MQGCNANPTIIGTWINEQNDDSSKLKQVCEFESDKIETCYGKLYLTEEDAELNFVSRQGWQLKGDILTETNITIKVESVVINGEVIPESNEVFKIMARSLESQFLEGKVDSRKVLVSENSLTMYSKDGTSKVYNKYGQQ